MSRSTHEDTTAVNPAYGVTQTLQDARTLGVGPAESAYDYPTISIDISETRTNEACGAVYEIIAAGHRESTYSHPVAEFQAGTDGNRIKVRKMKLML